MSHEPSIGECSNLLLITYYLLLIPCSQRAVLFGQPLIYQAFSVVTEVVFLVVPQAVYLLVPLVLSLFPNIFDVVGDLNPCSLQSREVREYFLLPELTGNWDHT